MQVINQLGFQFSFRVVVDPIGFSGGLWVLPGIMTAF